MLSHTFARPDRLFFSSGQMRKKVCMGVHIRPSHKVLHALIFQGIPISKDLHTHTHTHTRSLSWVRVVFCSAVLWGHLGGKGVGMRRRSLSAA